MAVKALKSLAACIVSAAVAKSRFVVVGWCCWLPCCSPSLDMEGPTGGLPSQRLSSILAVLGACVGCPCNEAASPAMPEEMRGRGASAWLTPFPLPLVTDVPDHFLHSRSVQKLWATVSAQGKGPPFGLKQGILTSWRAPAFGANGVVPKGGSSPAPMFTTFLSVSCFMRLLNLSALWAGLGCK